MPFTLTLQEERNNPGQFQLVVNIDPKATTGASDGSPIPRAPTKQLYANLKGVPSLGYDVSPLYRAQKSSPPTSPQYEKQGWSDLDVPPEFLQKVVPDWKVTFSRNDSVSSNQSRKLADIKARIKKSGKGFVVRLLKGSSNSPESDEVAEVHLGQQAAEHTQGPQELDPGCRPVELDAADAPAAANSVPPNVFEIGTSSEPGVQRAIPAHIEHRIPSIPHWLNQTSPDLRPRNSISEEGFSDAETLTQEIRPFGLQLEDEQTEPELYSTVSSRLPTRTTSVSSIVKTPTRGLSVVGPVRRVGKANRARATSARGHSAQMALNRSDAHKSFKRRSPRNSNSEPAMTDAIQQSAASSAYHSRQRSSMSSKSQSERVDAIISRDNDAWQHPARDKRIIREKAHRRLSAEELLQPIKQKGLLRVQTDVARPKSASVSPVTRRKRPGRARHPSSSSSSSSSAQFAEEGQYASSPVWSEVDPSEELREALEKAFGTVEDGIKQIHKSSPSRSVPNLKIPDDEGDIGNIPLPLGLEIRSTPVNTQNLMLTFWGLAISSLSEKLLEGLTWFRNQYGREPPIPVNHVRVRWTCVRIPFIYKTVF